MIILVGLKEISISLTGVDWEMNLMFVRSYFLIMTTHATNQLNLI
jgi:hypothetical protein